MVGESEPGETHQRVEPGRWVEAVREAREAGYTYFDWMGCVDDGGTLSLVVHLWSVERREHRKLTTTVPDAGIDSLTAVFAGAAWPEREAAEMFGLTFVGHPDPRPLLLPDGFTGAPLRKDYSLAARVETPWPGAHDPARPGSARPPVAR